MIDETKIMQLADGTLPIEERAEVEEAIKKDPKLEKLFEDYQKTADLLFELGNEIKSTPIPAHIEKKLDSLKETRKIEISQGFIPKIKTFFRFQYVGAAAALAIFFYGGFYTQGVMMTKKISGSPELQAVGKKTENLKFRTKSNEDLSTRITNVYKFFDEIKFTDEINDIIVDLKEGEEFELSLKDASGTLIKFVLVKTYKSTDGSQCKNIAFKGKTLLSRSDTGANLNLNLCKKEDNFELVSINLSK